MRCRLTALMGALLVLGTGAVFAGQAPPAPAVSAQRGRGPGPVPEGIGVERNLVYARAGATDLLLDIYRPTKQAGPLPVVVWVYGGAFRAGSKDDAQTAGATWLVAHGYVVVAFNYRLSGEAKFPAQIHDCKAAIRWLRANSARYNLDADHIAAWGASAGGHLAAMLGTSGGVAELEGTLGNNMASSRVQAVVDFFGPTDFLQMDAAALPGGQKHNPADSPESQLVGGAIQDNKEKVTQANPITYVSGDDPPFLILHGERDPLVPVNQSELLFDALTRAGVKVTFHKVVGAGHGGPQFSTRAVRAMVLAFLDEHLKSEARPAAK